MKPQHLLVIAACCAAIAAVIAGIHRDGVSCLGWSAVVLIAVAASGIL